MLRLQVISILVLNEIGKNERGEQTESFVAPKLPRLCSLALLVKIYWTESKVMEYD
jgi:hypothetical protein